MANEVQTVLIAALKKWGSEYQFNVIMEEHAELIKACSKMRRAGLVPKNLLGNESAGIRLKITDSPYMDALIDEIADVYVVLGELELMYACDRQVNLKFKEKIDRLAQRIATKDNI